MKKTLVLTLLAALVVSLLFYYLLGGGPSVWGSFKNPETEKVLKQFVALKEKQANTDTNAMPREIQAMFKYAERGQWLSFSNAFSDLPERNRGFTSGPALSEKFWTKVDRFISDTAEKVGWHWKVTSPPRLSGISWEAIKEVNGAFDGFVTGDEKYSTEFGRDIIDSTPPGSVYFGGPDPGRHIVTAMCQTRPKDALFVIAQHNLIYEDYLDYLRSMYGKKIYIPTPDDREACLKEYSRSLFAHVSSLPDAMGLNGPLSKTIFDKCPTNEFFIEQNIEPGFSDWVNPYLEPHGLIFKISRQPWAALSDEIIQRDREYWRKSLTPKIGGWLREETTVQTIAAFVKKTIWRGDFSGFTGDPRFVRNGYSCKMFSQGRAAIAGLYAWRANMAKNDSEKRRLTVEADFAFRQAWALCPYGYGVVLPYINFLMSQNRFDDALLVAETMAALPQVKNDEILKGVPDQIRQYQREHPASKHTN